MNKQTLKARLLKWLHQQAPESFIPSGEIQRVVATATSYSPANVTRRLRELQTEGKVEVVYKKGHAHYRVTQKDSVPLDDELERIFG